MKASRIASLPLALCLAGSAFAGAPEGEYALEVGGPNEIWFPAGDDEVCEVHLENSICVVTTGAATDGKGAVTSTGMLAFHLVDLIDMDLPMLAAGNLSGSTKKPKLTVFVSGQGTATLHDDDFPDIEAPTKATGKLTCRNPLPHQPEFVCKGRLKLCFITPEGSFCARGGVHAGFLATGGSWLLAMDLETSKLGVVTGVASATLANATSEDFGVTGKYNPKKDSSKLKLVSTDPLSKNKAAFANLVVEPGLVTSGKLTFTIARGKGKEVIVHAP